MTAEQLTIHYEALSPLYTGNREGKVDRLHETGILGSLRWWLEALIRGVGGWARDPTEGDNNFDVEAYEKKFGPIGDDTFRHTARLRQSGLDDAAQVFGATGWRRRFRLELESEPNFRRAQWKGIQLPDRAHHGKVPRWPLKDFPFQDAFTIHLLSLDPDFPLGIIGGLLSFLEEWAGIGAKNQMGMGVICRTGGDEPSRGPLCDWLDGLPAASPGDRNRTTGLPSLDNLFLARAQVPDGDKETTFRFKTDLRRRFTNTDVRHYVMGTIKGGRTAARVKMSLPYQAEADGPYLMRVWGWLPRQATAYRAQPRDDILQTIHDQLAASDANLLWRELDSERDGVTPNQPDPRVFLRDLLGLPAATGPDN